MTMVPSAFPAQSAGNEQACGDIGAGAVVGKYRVLELLGSGGMGLVFRVQHVDLEREFALKTLRREWAGDSAARARFRSEMRALAAIRSEHVVSIVDAGVLPDGAPYFVMELLYGTTLREILAREEHLLAPRIIQIGIDACLGLARVHAAGFIHRDLKPENLFVARTERESEKTSILDLGVVRDENTDRVATSAGILVGTPRYMAPEQLDSDVKPGPAADIFSLGVILYECVAGFSPFEDTSVERRLFKIANSDFVRLNQIDHAIPNNLIHVIHQAMSHRSEDRHETALAFASALARCQQGEESPLGGVAGLQTRPAFIREFQSRPSVEQQSTQRPTRKRRSRAAWSALIICALSAIFGSLVHPGPRVQRSLHESKVAAAVVGESRPQQQVQTPLLGSASPRTSEPEVETVSAVAVRRSKQAKSLGPSPKPRQEIPPSDWASIIESRH